MGRHRIVAPYWLDLGLGGERLHGLKGTDENSRVPVVCDLVGPLSDADEDPFSLTRRAVAVFAAVVVLVSVHNVAVTVPPDLPLHLPAVFALLHTAHDVALAQQDLLERGPAQVDEVAVGRPVLHLPEHPQQGSPTDLFEQTALVQTREEELRVGVVVSHEQVCDELGTDAQTVGAGDESLHQLLPRFVRHSFELPEFEM